MVCVLMRKRAKVLVSKIADTAGVGSAPQHLGIPPGFKWVSAR